MEQDMGWHVNGDYRIRTYGPFEDNGFQDRRIRPLCQISRVSFYKTLVIKEQKGLCSLLSKTLNDGKFSTAK